jgi:hypothetical protein
VLRFYEFPESHRVSIRTTNIIERCFKDFRTRTRAMEWQNPKLKRKSVVHGHSQHKAIMGMNDKESVLSKLGLDIKILDSDCFGMSGAFGFEKKDYNVSIKVGKEELLPYIRDASKDFLVIANGFSYREQTSQTTDRHALHLAHVIQIAMREGPMDRKEIP